MTYIHLVLLRILSGLHLLLLTIDVHLLPVWLLRFSHTGVHLLHLHLLLHSIGHLVSRHHHLSWGRLAIWHLLHGLLLHLLLGYLLLFLHLLLGCFVFAHI